MIHHVDEFIAYFDGVRRRTLNYVRVVPADRVDWAPKSGEYTCGAIIRHLAAAEQMFVGVVVDGTWRYTGHDHDPASLEDLVAELDQGHTLAMDKLRGVSDDQLAEQRPSLQGPPARAWRWLMAMAEHEIHHRSQLAMYLMLMDVPPPHIFGLGVEDVIALAST
jgi:uncharacterized damage-inducible protein DinB